MTGRKFYFGDSEILTRPREAADELQRHRFAFVLITYRRPHRLIAFGCRQRVFTTASQPSGGLSRNSGPRNGDREQLVGEDVDIGIGVGAVHGRVRLAQVFRPLGRNLDMGLGIIIGR